MVRRFKEVDYEKSGQQDYPPRCMHYAYGDGRFLYSLITCGVCEFCRRGEPTTCPEHQIIGEHVNGGLADYTVVPAANL